MPRFVYGIRFKTVVLMLTITLIPTFLITGWLYRKTTGMLREEMKYNQLTGIESTIRFVDVVLGDMDLIASNILSNRDLQKRVSIPVENCTKYENYLNSLAIRSELGNLKNVNENIDSIYLYDWTNHRIFSTESYGYVKESQMDALGWSAVRQLTGGTRQWNVIRNGPSAENKNLISSKKQLVKNGEILFTFFINIDQKKFDTLLQELKGNPQSVYYIVDEDRQMIASSGAVDNEVFRQVNASLGVSPGAGREKTAVKRTGQPVEDFEMQTGKDTYYIVKRSIQEIGWTFVSVIPTEAIYGSLTTVRRVMEIICVISLLLILFFGFYMNQLIYVPMNKLISVMNQNKKGGPFTCDVERQKDEFGEIASNFNDLILEQHELNQKLFEQEMLTKNAEIRFLQSQINPHFLYNILDNIHWMARMGETKGVADMTFALSRFYRSSLSDGKELVTVAEAIHLVQAYFDIQKVRFHNRIEMITEVEPSLEQVLVPKRIFQPIIENAINHGVVNMEKKGFIMISGVDMGEWVKFLVEDNGNGLSAAETDRINREIEEGDFEVPGNFALKNLNRQLKLLYGGECGLSLESSKGKGTTVIIRVAKEVWQREGENHV